MLKINTKKSEGQWIPYPEDKNVQFLIRPFSIFTLSRLPSEETMAQLSPEEYWQIFNYCLMDWKGIYDTEEKPLKCNENNKKIVADHFMELASFVVTQAVTLKASFSEKEAKN
jgi:hypothetical protein